MAEFETMRTWAARQYGEEYAKSMSDEQIRYLYTKAALTHRREAIEREKGVQISIFEFNLQEERNK